jgi:Sec7-like guanine-nucleotide exchange factor
MHENISVGKWPVILTFSLWPNFIIKAYRCGQRYILCFGVHEMRVRQMYRICMTTCAELRAWLLTHLLRAWQAQNSAQGFRHAFVTRITCARPTQMLPHTFSDICTLHQKDRLNCCRQLILDAIFQLPKYLWQKLATTKVPRAFFGVARTNSPNTCRPITTTIPWLWRSVSKWLNHSWHIG